MHNVFGHMSYDIQSLDVYDLTLSHGLVLKNKQKKITVNLNFESQY